MRKKSIKESLLDNREYFEDMAAIIQHCLKLYPNQEYAELGVFLAFLRALTIVHQSHHWQTYGANFMGDHLLFERLYNETNAEVDVVAEKAVGVGGIELTNYFAQLHQIQHFLDGVAKGEALTTESRRAEIMLLVSGELILESLNQKGILTTGIEQAIGNVLDLHEGHLYLLQQRETK